MNSVSVKGRWLWLKESSQQSMIAACVLPSFLLILFKVLLCTPPPFHSHDKPGSWAGEVFYLCLMNE